MNLRGTRDSTAAYWTGEKRGEKQPPTPLPTRGTRGTRDKGWAWNREVGRHKQEDLNHKNETDDLNTWKWAHCQNWTIHINIYGKRKIKECIWQSCWETAISYFTPFSSACSALHL
jgi:hypothetical protein